MVILFQWESFPAHFDVGSKVKVDLYLGLEVSYWPLRIFRKNLDKHTRGRGRGRGRQKLHHCLHYHPLILQGLYSTNK